MRFFSPLPGWLRRYMECRGIFWGIRLLRLSGKNTPPSLSHKTDWNPAGWSSPHALAHVHSAICISSTRLWRSTKPRPCGRQSSCATSIWLAWGTHCNWCSTLPSPPFPPSSPSPGNSRTEAATAGCEERRMGSLLPLSHWETIKVKPEGYYK